MYILSRTLSFDVYVYRYTDLYVDIDMYICIYRFAAA
jgi:hypothetical protein